MIPIEPITFSAISICISNHYIYKLKWRPKSAGTVLTMHDAYKYNLRVHETIFYKFAPSSIYKIKFPFSHFYYLFFFCSSTMLLNLRIVFFYNWSSPQVVLYAEYL